jgi:hypothetical protein
MSREGPPMGSIPSVPLPGGFGAPPPSGGPRNPLRLLFVFAVTLGVVLLLVGAAVAAISPHLPHALCPDPTKPCGPPVNGPTLPPFTVGASGAPTAAPSLPHPPPGGATPTPSASTAAGSAVPSVKSAAAPLPQPLPKPIPASSAGPEVGGTVWTSSELGYSFQYDPDLWTIEQQDSSGVLMTAGNGNVALVITGALSQDASVDDALNGEVDRLSQNILGFTRQDDPSLLLPGSPHIGYVPGSGDQYVGTLNSPQGPTVAVDSAIVAATDQRITLLVSLTTVDQLRVPAYQAADSILNTVDWGSGQ